MSKRHDVVSEVIALAGGQAALAKALGISRAAVYQWDKVPAERCIAVEEAIGGQVTRYQMRPDIFGPAPASSDEAA